MRGQAARSQLRGSARGVEAGGGGRPAPREDADRRERGGRRQRAWALPSSRGSRRRDAVTSPQPGCLLPLQPGDTPRSPGSPSRKAFYSSRPSLGLNHDTRWTEIAAGRRRWLFWGLLEHSVVPGCTPLLQGAGPAPRPLGESCEGKPTRTPLPSSCPQGGCRPEEGLAAASWSSRKGRTLAALCAQLRPCCLSPGASEMGQMLTESSVSSCHTGGRGRGGSCCPGRGAGIRL